MTAKFRCRFLIHRDDANVLAIGDLDDGGMSVTNDAEAVVAYLTELQRLTAGKHLIYRDTEGRWDELSHDGAGKFLGFKMIGAQTMQDAITAATSAQ